ncbi:4428_t:CDS:2 [Diversispora eburnea]|uniref:4428_t:CDS:1 n=1 Tax=Diversispora eburnea TaxID=1213867 RepID=A0A9N8ZRP2_9GLOM|nr:4428_t:CDS:2 [Diversispora eburnea]
MDSEEEEVQKAANVIREKKKLIVQAHRARKMMKNRPIMPRTAITKSINEMEKKLGELGLDTSEIRARSQTRKRKRSESVGDEIVRESSRVRSASESRDRSVSGMRDVKQKNESEKQKKLAQRKPNRFAKVGESDRKITSKKPKHLYSSKSTIGKKDWR